MKAIASYQLVKTQLAAQEKTQVWLAAELGISPPYLNEQLSLRKTQREDLVQKIAAALGVAPGEITYDLNGRGDDQLPPATQQTIKNLLAQAAEKGAQRERCEKLIEKAEIDRAFDDESARSNALRQLESQREELAGDEQKLLAEAGSARAYEAQAAKFRQQKQQREADPAAWLVELETRLAKTSADLQSKQTAAAATGAASTLADVAVTQTYRKLTDARTAPHRTAAAVAAVKAARKEHDDALAVKATKLEANALAQAELGAAREQHQAASAAVAGWRFHMKDIAARDFFLAQLETFPPFVKLRELLAARTEAAGVARRGGASELSRDFEDAVGAVLKLFSKS